MKIRVLLTNKFNENDKILDIRNSASLIIDTIRATSTITTILSRKPEKLIISSSKKQSFRLKKNYPGYILCGEEKSFIIKGFDYDNSPVDLLNADLKGKTVVLKTTNGTNSFIKAKESKAAFSLSILNLNYATETALKYSIKNNTDLIYICSGKSGKISYDDAFTAGLSIKYLFSKTKNLILDDAAHLVYNSALVEDNIYEAFLKSCSGQYSYSISLEEDMRFCAELNIFKNCGKLEIDNSYKDYGRIYIIKDY